MIKKRLPCVLQHDAADCGAAAIATVLLFYKCEMSIAKIREIIGTEMYGTSMKGVLDGLRKFGFEAKGGRVCLDDMDKSTTLPAIARIRTPEGLNHFVVIHKVTNNFLIIADSAQGLKKIERLEFEKSLREKLFLWLRLLILN